MDASRIQGADDVARQLAIFTTKLRMEDLPANTVHLLKLHLLDTLGLMLAGSGHEVSRAVLRVLGAMGGRPESTVAGSQLRLPSPLAAFANATSVHSTELDGGHEGSNVHPQAAILPAVLAVAEATGASGRETLVAAAVGFEVALRLGLAMFPTHHRRGFHSTGSCGTIGVGAAVARLLALDADAATAALGLAATQATALRGEPGPGFFVMKRIHAGKAAHNGILAGLLAREGLPAAAGLISGSRGFLQLFSEAPHPERLLDGLGTHFVSDRCYLKPYAATRQAHGPIDSVLALRDQHRIDPNAAHRIEVRTYREAVQYGSREPASPEEAQFSLPYSIAVALLDSAALPAQYTEARLADPAVRGLTRKVEVLFDPEMDLQFVRANKRAHLVRVEMENGECWEGTTEYPSGSSRNPMPFSKVEAKFLDLSTPIVGRERALHLRDTALTVERVGRLEELVSSLSTGS